ncbi:hypothetical protein [Dermatobacter hominis]|uniref:hypothetical protein n=1 Tax=Dermatobacter hominis TaxID=2884263 RepID=UPI001D120B0C|nr:hypothetical protein [Dermatobacter hominis]UDY36234.1 hypothetical protein LH044_01550 [Dermatobacter hominis]
MPPTAAPGDAPAPPQDPPVDGGDDRPSGRRRFFLAAGLLFVVATFAVWIYALFLYDPGLMIDELEDRTFPTQAEEICHQARVRIEALPTADQTPDHVERADVVDQANEALRDMTAQLAPIVPQGEGKVSSGIEQWIEDWDTYIGDRQDYADQLREDPMTRFSESLKANRQISRAIDAFAQVNRMESCMVPGDVG